MSATRILAFAGAAAAAGAVVGAAAASGAAAPPFAPLIQLQGMQGQDDQTMALYAIGLDDNQATLKLRYDILAQQTQPGLRRYNAFWSGAEGAVAPQATPFASCPPGTFMWPTSESERVARGYNLFHCYDTGFYSNFDTFLALDASIGAASAFIVYGSPAWAVSPGCTGFPWGPVNYTQGCLPWGHLDAWSDYILSLAERWNAPWGSGQARISHLCVWNEVQSMGWADPSPVLPNRFSGTLPYFTEAQYEVYAGMIANLTIIASTVARRHVPDLTVWLSTDHFTTPPPLNKGDVGHVGLYDLLDHLWPLLNASGVMQWGVAVHPYDAGDPRQNLTGQGVYTFATLKESVADVQCAKLVEYLALDSPADCWAYPQVRMWASEQGWPYNKDTMNKTIQARNICMAHGLSLAQNVYSVSHNFFQSPTPTSQGDAGDFSLVDEPPVCFANLTTCGAVSETYQAYMATAPSVYGIGDGHYCCTRWGWGCVGPDGEATMGRAGE
jgi:hypothetical protein